MAAVVRYLWMFRTAAVLCVLFGVFWLIDATLLEQFAAWRPHLLVLGVVSIAVGVTLFRRMKLAIALSALGAVVISICAAVGAPRMHGPGILALGLLSIAAGLYAVLSARALFSRG
jgi:hypothetical protein